MTATMEYLSEQELGQLSEKGRAAYEQNIARHRRFEERRALAKNMADRKPEAEKAAIAASEKLAEEKAAWDQAQAAFQQAKARFANAQQECEAAQRNAGFGWHENQLRLLADESIADGIHSLTEEIDGLRNGSARRIRSGETQDRIATLQEGVAKLEALKFDATVKSLKDLIARVQSVVDEYLRAG